MENYFASQRDHIFKNVEVLIYVFDVESRDVEKDMHYYQSCLEAIMTNSKDAKIFCLIHKMDLVQEDQRDKIYNERVLELQTRSLPLQVIPFRTSIWDETLYKVMKRHHEQLFKKKLLHVMYESASTDDSARAYLVFFYFVNRLGRPSSIRLFLMFNSWRAIWITFARFVRQTRLFCLRE